MPLARSAAARRPGNASRRFAVLASTCALAVLLTPGTTPLRAPAAEAAGALDRTMARRMCDSGATKEWGLAVKDSDAADARALMRGRISLKGGTFVIAANPTWKRQSGLDDSGNNQQHALHWAMPLLRVGIATHNAAMVRRFYALVGDWVRDNPPGRGVTPGAWQDFQVGYRLLTLSCAVAGPQGSASWLATAVRAHVKQVSRSNGWQPVNNTGLLSTSGLLAAACMAHDHTGRSLALSRFQYLAGRLYRTDGSDREGSPHYTLMNWMWHSDHLARIRACGVTAPPAMVAGARMPSFIAAATRPDGKMESIGDGGVEGARPPTVLGTVAEFAATKGASGPAPTAVFSRFASGTIFDRTGWGGSRAFSQETFWSMRTGDGPPSVFHGHADQTAITYFAGGSPLLVDSGVYRYSRNAARDYVVSRRAHSAVSIARATPSAKGVVVRAATHTSAWDLVSVEDRNYKGVLITRDVYFSRRGEWLLVLDTVTSKTVVRADQRWQLPSTRGTRVGPGFAESTGTGANVALRWLGPAIRPSVEKGLRSPYSGWTSTAYGNLTAAPVVQSSQGGTAMRWATVIVPVRPGDHYPIASGTDASASLVTGSVTGVGASSVVTATVRMHGGVTETVRLRHAGVLSVDVD